MGGNLVPQKTPRPEFYRQTCLPGACSRVNRSGFPAAHKPIPSRHTSCSLSPARLAGSSSRGEASPVTDVRPGLLRLVPTSAVAITSAFGKHEFLCYSRVSFWEKGDPPPCVYLFRTGSGGEALSRATGTTKVPPSLTA